VRPGLEKHVNFVKRVLQTKCPSINNVKSVKRYQAQSESKVIILYVFVVVDILCTGKGFGMKILFVQSTEVLFCETFEG